MTQHTTLFSLIFPFSLLWKGVLCVWWLYKAGQGLFASDFGEGASFLCVRFFWAFHATIRSITLRSMGWAIGRGLLKIHNHPFSLFTSHFSFSLLPFYTNFLRAESMMRIFIVRNYCTLADQMVTLRLVRTNLVSAVTTDFWAAKKSMYQNGNSIYPFF